MRNPERIPLVLDAVRRYWEQHPDLRLGQIMWIMAEKDPFYFEDDKLFEKILSETNIDSSK